MHTCDRRRTRTWIAETYPDYRIEAGFAEEDGLWDDKVRETDADVERRVRLLLDDVFGASNAGLISFTAHSGLVHGLHAVTGHPDVWLAPGALVPFFIRATRIQGKSVKI